MPGGGVVLWPLVVVLMLAACASPPQPTIAAPPSPDNVVIGQTQRFATVGVLATVDGDRGPFPRELALAPGRHTLVLRNSCTPGVSNVASARIDMRFAPGTAYRVTGQRHLYDQRCRVGLVAELDGRVICEVETRTNEFSHRLVSSLDHVTEHCQGWTSEAVAGVGTYRPWSGPFPLVPYDIDDPVALAEIASTALWGLRLPFSGRERRELIWPRPALFVVPFAERFPGDADGVVSGHGVLLPDGPLRTDSPLPTESWYVRVPFGHEHGYRTYFIAWFLMDAAALSRFRERLRRGVMPTLDAEPGVVVKVWSGDGPRSPGG